MYGSAPGNLLEGFLVVPLAQVRVCDDVAEGLLPVKVMLGFCTGGMGHAARSFHAGLMARTGYEEEVRRIQDLFLSGRGPEAVRAVPDAFADEISPVGRADGPPGGWSCGGRGR